MVECVAPGGAPQLGCLESRHRTVELAAQAHDFGALPVGRGAGHDLLQASRSTPRLHAPVHDEADSRNDGNRRACDGQPPADATGLVRERDPPGEARKNPGDQP